MKKKESRPKAQNAALGRESTPSQRVTWLLDNIWNGNRSEMARAIGVTHSVLAKVAAGTQSAGRRLLGAIASHPKINPAWLLNGQGEPLLVESGLGPTDGWPVPISTQLLFGTPEKHRDLLNGEHFSLAGSQYRVSRYWLRVSPNDAIVEHPFIKVRPYDLLLMETDSSWWQDPMQFDQRICGIKLPNSPFPRLGIVTYRGPNAEEPGLLCAEMFDKQPDASKEVVQISVLLYPNGEVRASRKRMTEEGASRRLAPARQSPTARFPEYIEPANVISACVLIIRP